MGAGLGFVDGLTSWFTPEVRPEIMGILIGSTLKGMIVGVAAGFFARKVRSIPLGVGFGVVLAAAFAYWVAAQMGKYYLEIMLPGSIVGAIVGFATQRWGRAAGAVAGSAGGMQE